MSDQLPLTIAGRSPFDPIRLRWGGLGGVLLGAALAFQGEPAAIVFGVLFVILGTATWLLTRFGTTPWQHLTPTQKGVAGTGAITGLLFLYTFFLCFFVTWWMIRLLTGGQGN